MDGKATLKLRGPSKDNVQNLYFYNYDVIYCEYSFDKGITAQGQVCTDVLAGNIRVTLPMLPGDELMAWVLDAGKKYNGEITINDAYEESLERIYFEEGRCVGFRMHYEPAKGGRDVILSLTINAQRMIIGEVEYKNRY
ncbi:MAG: hypothetical protein FWF54_00330 [Candidatus Azobacteroides sp.]|jgi:hypothetical protein|nr:hypothetical protein [Candidatus Azobacteroides sp.]